jgi:hypothetical protein
MANVPEDAQRSPDGHYWWDGAKWQLIDDGTASGTTSSTDSGDSERAAARVAAGYPASAEHLTDDQKKTLLGEPTAAVEAISHDEVEVAVMDSHANGEATA